MKKSSSIVLAAVLTLGGIGAAAIPANAAGIETWHDSNYRNGYSNWGKYGTSYVGSNHNDKISSLKVQKPANVAILFEHRDHKGNSIRFEIGAPNLAQWGFNDKTSSIK